MQRVVQPIAAGVSGKYPTRTIATVSRRCQSHDKQLCAGITKPGHGPAPVLLSGKLAFANSGNLGAVSPQSGTELACGNEVGQPGEWFPWICQQVQT